MELKGEKVVLLPYTLERCNEFYREYVADPNMTYDEYVYDKDKVDIHFQNKVLDSSRIFFAICRWQYYRRNSNKANRPK